MALRIVPRLGSYDASTLGAGQVEHDGAILTFAHLPEMVPERCDFAVAGGADQQPMRRVETVRVGVWILTAPCSPNGIFRTALRFASGEELFASFERDILAVDAPCRGHNGRPA